MDNLIISTSFVGHKIIYLPICHSTNLYAQEWLASHPVEEGLVILSDKQTAGKGQRGNTWEAEPGKNITLSVVLTPYFLPLKQLFYLNIVVSLAVFHFLQKYIINGLKIKWPNDLIYENKKISGILVENSIREQQIESAIAGIGININQGNFSIPSAASLKTITGKDYDLIHLIPELLSHLEEYYLMLKKGEFSALKEQYLSVLFKFEENVIFRAEELFEAKIVDVDEDGKLVVLLENHQQRSFDIKEVSFIY